MARTLEQGIARPGLFPEVRSAAGLGPALRDEMYALFARAYEGTDRQRFGEDLDAKRDVILLRDESGTVAGFTTLAVLDDTHNGRALRIVYSGDTLVDPRHWGSHALNFAWIRHVDWVAAEAPGVPLYWLLVSKGFRTYRYLSTFARDYVPRRDRADDAALIALRDRLANRLFGAAYDPSTGVVTHVPPRDRLARDLLDLPRTGPRAAEAEFFARANPGFRRGDELVCLCPLDRANMRPFARRLLERATA